MEAARGLDFPFTLTARAENHIRGNPDLDDTIARLRAFEEAGADVLYAPGLRDRGRGAGGVRGGLEARQRARAAGAVGARDRRGRWARISVGGGLTWVAVSALVTAASEIRDGDLSSLSARLPLGDWLAP